MRENREKRVKSIPRYHGDKGEYWKEGRPQYVAWAMELTEWCEGRRNRVYFDGENPPVVGVGFYLDRKRNRKILEKLGIDYIMVSTGAECLNGWLIEQMLEEMIKSAVSSAVKWVRNYHELDDARKAAIAYMLTLEDSFKMNKVADKLEKKKFKDASEELRKTKFYKKFPEKAEVVAKILEQGKIEEIKECPIFFN